MRAELIAIGTELLLFGRHDTNGDWLAARLAERGIEVGRRTVARDAEAEIVEILISARARSQLVVLSGGLGPTKDDVTREALARSLGRPLLVDPVIRERILSAYRARGYPAEGPADAQARIPGGCEPIENPVGSAPGILHPGPPCWTIALPGVPAEMRAMFDPALELCKGALPSQRIPQGRLLLGGMVESEADERLRDLIGNGPSATVTILAGEGGVEILVMGSPADPGGAATEVTRILSEARRRFGTAVVGEGDETLAGGVGRLLLAHGARLAVAESCTGGLLGARITEVPGASEWFVGGFLTYSNALKHEILGVSARILEEHGSVSEEAAAAMASGARSRAGATHALSVTGIAGPNGGSEEKPVGLVFFGLADENATVVKKRFLKGDRQTIRARAVAIALDLLRRRLVGDLV